MKFNKAENEMVKQTAGHDARGEVRSRTDEGAI